MFGKIFKLTAATVIVVALGGCSSIGSLKGGSASAKSAKQQDRLAAAGLILSEENNIKTRHDILFQQGTDRLSEEAVYVITDAAQFLLNNKRRTASIVGHTDASGWEKDNMNLSIQRAFAVRNALIAEGIEAHRLEPVGKGEMRPVASNESAKGRKMNRRVEILFP